jgi:hypothetical protein
MVVLNVLPNLRTVFTERSLESYEACGASRDTGFRILNASIVASNVLRTQRRRDDPVGVKEFPFRSIKDPARKF